MEKELNHRIVFARQPARVLMVDLNNPFDMDTCHHLNESLECFLSLVCSLAGPARLPFFGLFSLSSRCEATGYWCQLEVFIITCQDGVLIGQQVEKEIRALNLDILKKVQVIHLQSPEHLVVNLEAGSSSQASNTSVSLTSGIDGIVDIITVNIDPLSLDNFFKSWMQDGGTDKEHIHLILPASLNGSEDLHIKCDINERLINSNLLPFSSSFSLQVDAGLSRPNLGAGMKQGGFTIPVHKLCLVSKISSSEVCESVLFGQPIVLKPTCCWKLDWDELDSNQQLFQSLCCQLQEQAIFLLCKLQVEKMTMPVPQGYFVILPSDSSTLLLKSVAVSELMLPCPLLQLDIPPADAMQKISESLDKMDFITEFNPLLFKSGLYKAITHSLKQQRQPQTKRKSKNQSIESEYVQPENGAAKRGFAYKPVFKSARSMFPTQL